MTIERTFETPDPVRLSVQNESGLVTVVTDARDTTDVVVSANSAEAEDLVERTLVECRRDQVVVKVPRQRKGFFRQSGVTVHVSVPERSDLTIATASADIDVSGLIATADLTTASGDITTDDVSGEVRAKTASGDLTVGNVGGELRMATASGSLRCSSVEKRASFSSASGDVELGLAQAPVEVKTTSGTARLGELDSGADVVNVSGNVRVLSLRAGTLRVRSVSGDVTVGVAEGVDLHVDVETMSGRVHSAIPLDDVPAQGHTGKSAELSVRTVSGDIEMERAALAPVA
jgi:DUF4097 and DUF4098 domain-containing protein YvlB